MSRFSGVGRRYYHETLALDVDARAVYRVPVGERVIILKEIRRDSEGNALHIPVVVAVHHEARLRHGLVEKFRFFVARMRYRYDPSMGPDVFRYVVKIILPEFLELFVVRDELDAHPV